MAAAKLVALFALLQLSAAWLLAPQADNFTFDNETANCSSSTYDEWLELQPEPLYVDSFPGEPEPEEAEEVEDYVEPEVGIDEDVDPSESESTDLVDDDVDGVEEVYDDNDDDLQDFIVNDDVLINRFRRDVVGVDIQHSEDLKVTEGSDEHDANKDSSEEEGNETKSSEEKRSEDNGEESEEDSEGEKDDPFAYLRVKIDRSMDRSMNRSMERLLAPEERVKVMLKNFQKSRMNFLVTASSYEEDDIENAGSFTGQPFLIKLKGCWLEHKHNAHKICKHHHGRKHGHGRGRGHGHAHGNGHGHSRGRRHHGHGQHNHQDDHHHQNDHHQSDRHPYAEANEVENDTVRQEENNTASNFKSHKFMEPAEGEASLCSPTQLEGWLGPESKVVIAYSAPSRGCIVIRAYVSFPINDGSLVFTSEGNAEYLQYLSCVQPNPIPEEDVYVEYDYESNDITDDSDDDGIDPANIIASPDVEDNEEENSFTPRRGLGGYNLRPRQPRNEHQGSSEEVSADDEQDEDYVPSFIDHDRNRRSPDEMESQHLDRRQRRQQMRQARWEQKMLRRQGRHNRRDAGEDTASPATNLIEETSERPLNPRQQRRQQRKQRRQQKRQERQGGGATESTPEATGTEGRRGKGGRRNRQNRRNRQQTGNNRRLHNRLTDAGSKFCCKQGIQHKKASTYADDDGTTPALNCTTVPDEVPIWASHKHPISKEICEGHYVRCCNEFDLELWNSFKARREERRAQRTHRQQG